MVNTASDFRKNNAAAVVKKIYVYVRRVYAVEKNSLKCGSMLVFLFRLKFVSAAVMYKSNNDNNNLIITILSPHRSLQKRLSLLQCATVTP